MEGNMKKKRTSYLHSRNEKVSCGINSTSIAHASCKISAQDLMLSTLNIWQIKK